MAFTPFSFYALDLYAAWPGHPFDGKVGMSQRSPQLMFIYIKVSQQERRCDNSVFVWKVFQSLCLSLNVGHSWKEPALRLLL